MRPTLFACLFLVGLTWAAHADEGAPIEVTNVHQIRLYAARNPKEAYSIRLRGDVWWANPGQNALVLKDDSGVEELERDLHGSALAAGYSALLIGHATITPAGAGFRLGNIGPVVDNDGVHMMVEKSGSVYLAEGRNPIRVEWFNGVEKYGLRVEYQGPGLPRQQIPNAALSGMDYVCVAAPAEMLPDFDHSPVLARGAVSNFDLGVMVRPEHIALRFIGFLEIPRAGLYTFYTTSDDGSRLIVGGSTVQLTRLAACAWPKPERLAIGQAWASKQSGLWAEVEGNATFLSRQADGMEMELSGSQGRMLVMIAKNAGLTPESLLNRRLRATGYCEMARTSDGKEVAAVLLAPGAREITVLDASAGATLTEETNRAGLPFLESAAEIHRLKREEAQRGYPVKLRGTITSVLPEHQAFTIQDATRGVYVIDFSDSLSEPPRIGQFLEVDGVTGAGEFAPIVNARRVISLGLGDLPEPVHPTREQLMNGSLDAQYVELQGILTDVQSNQVTLLTPDGRIKSELRATGLPLQDMKVYEDALVRVRGCLFATWNYVTHQVKVGEIRIYGAAVNVEQPAPADIFSTPRKTAAELFLFDPQASALQRVKVSGQVIHVRPPEYFLMDGESGVRFVAKNSEPLAVGDTVDVVGFPELSSGLPILREAVARITGHAPLPQPRALNSDDLGRADLDTTLVRLKAVLVNQRNIPAGLALEMRIGLRSFLALLPNSLGALPEIPLGSQLELTGVYASQGISQEAGSFGLLLNSPADISVLARPPWWTLEKLLVILGALGCVLAVSVLWITQLRRKVGQRTAELEIQIRERQRAEQQHTLELERARIAQDLHDELGSGLTEISMLGIRAQSDAAPIQARGSYLEEMSSKARQMVSALDEIVWAMNPTHDSLQSMVSYFALYAERFLGLAGIAWRLKDAGGVSDYALDSRHRHQLFLAFKEALTNVVRHSGATEVTLEIKVQDRRLFLAVEDNGRGWDKRVPQAGMDGLANMRARLVKLGGCCAVRSEPRRGTVIGFDLPLN